MILIWYHEAIGGAEFNDHHHNAKSKAQTQKQGLGPLLICYKLVPPDPGALQGSTAPGTNRASIHMHKVGARVVANTAAID